MAIRLLLVANIIMLTGAGALCFIFVTHPAGIAVGLIIWAGAAVLLGLIRYTNPHRGEQSRW